MKPVNSLVASSTNLMKRELKAQSASVRARTRTPRESHEKRVERELLYDPASPPFLENLMKRELKVTIASWIVVEVCFRIS